MNTAGGHIPVITKPRDDYTIILDEYEFYFENSTLKRIAILHNNGRDIKFISEITKRKPVELLLALIHLANKGQITRPLAKLL